jgi:hypothetical protein
MRPSENIGGTFIIDDAAYRIWDPECCVATCFDVSIRSMESVVSTR